MKTFISDLIPKIQQYSQKLDNLTLLTNQHWVVIDEIDQTKCVYIFRANKELLVSSNGLVEKGKWEYLGNNSLLIDRHNNSYLFKHGFFDENILALKIDGKNEYAFLINENRYDGELNSFERIIDFLNKTYLKAEVRKVLGEKYEFDKYESIPITVQKTADEITKGQNELEAYHNKNFTYFVILIFAGLVIISLLLVILN